MSAANPFPARAVLRPSQHAPQNHGGGVPVRRGALAAIGLGASVLAVWAGVATWCLLRGETFSAGFFSRLTERERAYEDRIGALRSRLDRVTSQKLIEQEGLDARLAQIVARQKELESRQATLADLADEAGSAPVRRLRPRGAPPASDLSAIPSAGSKPAPLPDPLGLRLGDGSLLPEPAALPRSPLRPEERLSVIEQSLRSLEAAQLRSVEAIRRASETRVSRLKAVIGSLGLRPERLTARLGGGIGGPLVPLAENAPPASFEAAAVAARHSLAELAQLRRASAALPLGRPAAGEADLASGFGMRIDPFTRGPALHTGLDIRADHGADVRATAAGRVTAAEYSGGYGRMVEIDHGNGLSTRYAHLSSIRVVPDEIVATGTIVGRVGSTGRSTGPHLHYETRIDGVPIDPQPFLRAGAKLHATNIATAE